MADSGLSSGGVLVAAVGHPFDLARLAAVRLTAAGLSTTVFCPMMPNGRARIAFTS
jgi:hypothetical protein